MRWCPAKFDVLYPNSKFNYSFFSCLLFFFFVNIASNYSVVVELLVLAAAAATSSIDNSDEAKRVTNYTATRTSNINPALENEQVRMDRQ